MIHLFRKLRKQFLSRNNLGKYLVYASGEVILVVIGILIALQLNNLNDNHNKHQNLIQSLKNIASELDEEIDIMESDFERYGNYANYYNSILSKSYSDVDPKLILNKISRNITVREFGATYFSALSNGSLSTAPDSLSSKLIHYYHVSYKTYYNTADYHRTMVSQTIEDHIIRNYDFGINFTLDSTSAIKVIESNELNAYINYQAGFFENFVTTFNKNLEEAKKTNKEIKEFIMKNED